jgi:site-specific DNA recombinase
LKNAIAYIRISTKDQSNFSISGQAQFIQDFTQRKSINLIGEFIDNGQSAKNFDRADWKKLESFVKKNYKNIDHLIVVKYDRFSRNVAEGLNMIEKLEKSYGISVLSVFEEIAISPESPFFFKMRADMLVQAEFELRVIRDRTKFGVKQAKKEGRWITLAPYGYINKRDSSNKPIIEIDPEKETIVKEIFNLWIEGTPLKRIDSHVVDMGYKQKSKSALTRILKNPVYAGFVTHEDKMYKGLHSPIISLDTFNEAQRLFSKETKIKVLLNEEVPLRGVLKCSCGKYLTAGKSKGKTNYYWYYKCLAHLEVNYSANIMHSKMR